MNVIIVLAIDSDEDETFFIVEETRFNESEGNDMMEWVMNACDGNPDTYTSWSSVTAACTKKGATITDVRGALSY